MQPLLSRRSKGGRGHQATGQHHVEWDQVMAELRVPSQVEYPVDNQQGFRSGRQSADIWDARHRGRQYTGMRFHTAFELTVHELGR